MKFFLQSLAFRIALVILLLGFAPFSVFAQFPTTGGTYTIDNTQSNTFSGGTSGNFTGFTNAVAALNATTGTISGGITFNVASGQTFTEPSVVCTYTNPNNQPIVFQKSSATNPLLQTTSAGTGTAVFTISGGSNFTFNGIDLQDNTAGMATGFLLLSTSANGCSNNTFENGTINLNATASSSYTYCIYSNASVNTTANSNNYFYNNILKNAVYGIFVQGNGTNYDQGNQVAANTVSNLYVPNSGINSNQGGMVGIGFAYQQTFSIYNNLVGGISSTSIYPTYAIGTPPLVSGIGAASTFSIYGNTIGGPGNLQITGNGSGNSIFGIYTGNGIPQIYNNTINNLTVSGGATGVGPWAIYDISTANLAPHNIFGNTIFSISSTAMLPVNGILVQGGSTRTVNVYQNKITGLSTVGGNTAVCLTGIQVPQAVGLTINIYGNTIGNPSVANDLYLKNDATAGHSASGINIGQCTAANIYNNVISNVTGQVPNTTNAPTIGGILSFSLITTLSMYGNSVSTITSQAPASGSAAGVTGIYNVGTTGNVYANTVNGVNAIATTGIYQASGIVLGSGNQTMNAYNNMIGNISNLTDSLGYAAGINVACFGNSAVYNNMIYGISANSSTASISKTVYTGANGILFNTILLSGKTLNVFFNSIFLNDAAAAGVPQTSAAFCTRNTGQDNSIFYSDNIFANLYTPSANPASVAYGAAIEVSNVTYINSTSNNNFIYAGTPGAQHNIAYCLGNVYQSLTDYKGILLFTPRETNAQTYTLGGGTPVSFNGATPFFAGATNLHLNAAGATDAIGNGIPVLSPVSITADIDGDVRSITSPTIGADEICNGITLTVSADTTICAGTQAPLRASGASSYSWSPTSTLTCSACANPIATPLSTTTYNVTASNGGCSVSREIVVTVAGAGGGQAGHITANRDTICRNTTVSLTLNNSLGNAFQWQSSASANTGFTAITGASNMNYTSDALTETIYYRVVVGGGGPCADTTAPIRIFVPATLSDTFSYAVSGKVVTFNSAKSTGSIVVYTWDFGDGKTGADANPVHTYDKADSTYTVCLTIYDGSNCSYTECETVTVPGLTGILNTDAGNSWFVYPNPFTSEIFIKANNFDKVNQIEIFDLPGKLILSETINQKDNSLVKLNGSLLPQGIYMLKMETQQGSFVWRMVKQ